MTDTAEFLRIPSGGSFVAQMVDTLDLDKAAITLTEQGTDSTGRSLRNPVTDEALEAHTVMSDGFIWKDGPCDVGSFSVAAEGIELDFSDTHWIR